MIDQNDYWLFKFQHVLQFYLFKLNKDSDLSYNRDRFTENER